MTIDDENSIYVGGLPYECTESQLRRIFELHGSVVAVKIVNGRGKCYGFVTYKNPRSVIEAIREMDGQNIGGRVVRVNEVMSRGAGGKSNHGLESLRHDQRDMDWKNGRVRERENGYGKERQHDHSQEHDGVRERRRSHSKDRFQGRENGNGKERQHDRSREHDGVRERRRSHSRDRFQGRDRDQSRDLGEYDGRQTHSRNRDLKWDGNNGSKSTEDRKFDKVGDHDRRVDKSEDQHSKRFNSSGSCERKCRDFPSESSDYQYQVEEQLDLVVKRRDELQNEKSDLEQRVEEKKQLIADLQKKSLKLEDSLASAKKQSSMRQMQLSKLYKCFQQVKDYGKKLKSSEEALQDLVNSVSMEIDAGGDLGARKSVTNEKL